MCLFVNLVGVHVYTCRHDSSGKMGWAIGRASVSSPVDHLLCSKHYQQVYNLYSAVGLNGYMSIVPHLPYTDFVTNSESKQVESYIGNTVDFSDTIQDGDQVCHQCNKFFNQKLMSSECMLSKFKAKNPVNFSM